MTECLILDFDGTLVDSEALCNQAFLDLIPDITDSLDFLVQRYSGRKLSWILSDIQRRFDVRLPSDFERRYRARVAELFDSKLEAFEGVHEALAGLPMPVCIATSAPLSKVEPALRKTDLSAYFGGNVFSSYEIGSWKPEPDIFLHAAKTMGVAADSCVVLDDSVAGIQAAIAAGMRAIQFCGSATPFHDDYIRAYSELNGKMERIKPEIDSGF